MHPDVFSLLCICSSNPKLCCLLCLSTRVPPGLMVDRSDGTCFPNEIEMISLAGLPLPSQECILALESLDIEKGDLVLYIGRKGACNAATMGGFRKATKQKSLKPSMKSLAGFAVLLPFSLVQLQSPCGPGLTSDSPFGLSVVVVPQKLQQLCR